jgi:tetratricopeptide (TPR) repeat protein
MTIGAKQLIFSKIETLIKGLERSNSNESRIVEMRAAMHFAKGKMFRRFRVLPKATEEIEKSLNLRKKLYDEAPNDSIRASRYAASLELWGDQLRDLRAPEGGLKMRADEAIVHYREALTVREHLTKEYPDHDRALSWEIGRAKLNARIGDAYKELGQPQHAEDFYRRALAISVPEYLTRQSEDGMDELGWNLRKLGEILAGGASPSSNSSATAEAIEALEGSLCVRRHRYERNPDEIERERDVSFALVGLGRILVLQQRYDDAESHYYEALELRRKFVRSDPDNKEYSRDVFFSYADVSEFEGKRNNWERAYVHAMHALDHLRKYQNIAEEQRVPERMKRLQNQVQEIRSQFGSPPLNDFNNIALSSDALYQQFLFSVTEPISIPERKTRAAALNQNFEDRENRKDCATRIRRAFGSSTAQRIGE